MVWEEANIARERINRMTKTNAAVMLLATGTGQLRNDVASAKRAFKTFNKFLEQFDDGEDQ
jgi:hypothetical protein